MCPLDSLCNKGRFYQWTSLPMDVFTNGRFHQWTFLPMDVFTNGRFHQWTFLPMDVFTNGRFYQWTFLPMDVFTNGRYGEQRNCHRETTCVQQAKAPARRAGPRNTLLTTKHVLKQRATQRNHHCR